ncbi:MAG: DEAD/DEAH box helicase, partial [Chloroflexi bacterium]
MVYVRVAVNVPAVSGEFDYHLPAELEGPVAVGHLVTVPFGNQTVQGVVLEFVPQPAVADTKPVLALVDETPVLTSPQIFLARQLAESTLNPVAAIVSLMIPPGLAQQADTLYSVISDQLSGKEQNTTQKRLLALLKERGPLRGRQIDRHFGPLDWRKAAQWLARGGVLASKPVLPPPTVHPKSIRVAQLAVTPEVAEAAMPELGKTAATLERRQKALRFLIHEPQAVAVSWVYAESGCSLADLQELAERELIVVYETEIFRDPLQKIGNRELGIGKLGEAELVLTPEQEAALIEILRACQPTFDLRPSTAFLLHGVTGSGKTEIYLRAVAETLRRGKQAIILVPEIALTPQTVRRFLARFPGQVGLIHSKLSDGERYDTWRRARAGQLKVIIGARSALFAPLPNIGLIVADECHDHSYYQSEPPFYHAIRAAQLYAQICGAVCVLGSATPPVELKYLALTPGPSPDFGRGESAPTPFTPSPVSGGGGRGVRALSLPNRVVGAQTDGVFSLPPVSIVDMREELKTGNRGIFSRELAESLAETLERGEQAILFLNRRGTATYVFCR